MTAIQSCALPLVTLLITSIMSVLSPSQALERGIAFTDPALVRHLDGHGFNIGSMIGQAWPDDDRMSNATWHRAPAMAPIYAAIKSEIEDYEATHQRLDAKGNKKLGVGMRFDHRLFDLSFLRSPHARFVLVGAVNRMDRAFKSPATCGEVRLIYRLNYTSPPALNGKRVSSRLPMTLNVVFNARRAGDETPSCKAIAESWLAAGRLTETGEALAAKLIAPGAPLAYFDRSLIDRIEINMQLVRWPASEMPDFGGLGEYLLRVFRWNGRLQKFEPALMENQIDRDALLADPAKRADFKDWMLQPDRIKQLDTGTLIIPDRFLAGRAVSVNPGGTARSKNRPFSRPSQDLISDADITAALRRLKNQGTTPLYIPTAYGFQHRLNDMTCTGCHQTRSVAGFHFMGHEWLITLPANSAFTPASPHFFGDAPRRRHIVEAFAASKEPDFSKGFASRPQKYRSRALYLDAQGRPLTNDRGLMDGWGAHCYAGSDPSFKSWACAPGLTCKVSFQNEREPDMGICVTKKALTIGDAFEFGTVKNVGFGNDKFTPTETLMQKPKTFQRGQPWVLWPTSRDGGFSGGMIRATSCPDRARGDKLLPREAICAILPSSKPVKKGEEGFNTCLLRTTFPECINRYSEYSGLRACDVRNPCRDDYICTATDEKNRGACLPPYFLFQFRVDGHLGAAEP